MDGMSPTTQIMTAFSTIPDLTGWLTNIPSGRREAGHATILLNLETGEKVAHWVETDARADDETGTIVFIRTLVQLEPNTAYGVGISGLNVTPSIAFQAVLDGQKLMPRCRISSDFDGQFDWIYRRCGTQHDESQGCLAIPHRFNGVDCWTHAFHARRCARAAR